MRVWRSVLVIRLCGLSSLHCGYLAFREDFGKRMVASMAGRQAPGISRPPVVLRSSCSGVLHRAVVSVRGLAGASCMDSTLRILRPLSGTGVGSHTQSSVASSSSMLRGCPVGLGAHRKGLLVRGHIWQRHNCKGGIRCEAAAASSAEGTAFGPDANASPAPGRVETMSI